MNHTSKHDGKVLKRDDGLAAGREPTESLVPPISPAPICLVHLDRMTDSTGLIQHAIYSVPRRESGYTTDDNARALRLCVRLWSRRPEERMLTRVTQYLSFLEHARCHVRGFHNFLSYQRDWLDATGEGDCQGQAILALAEVLGSRLPIGLRDLARELAESVLPALAELRSLRAQAYVIQAWNHLRRCGATEIDGLASVARHAADRLVECFHRSQRPGWPWFESRMTYANAVLPHAMFDAGECWPDEAYLTIAEASFDFLTWATTTDQVFWPIGNRDWYSHGEEKSLFDQQPVEASTMASAAVAGLRCQGLDKYMIAFVRSHGWFYGQNCRQQSMADTHDGSCFDGIQTSEINRNQGAESTLAYLWTELLVDAACKALPECSKINVGRE